jgi:methionyl-tRNA formyltransferase
MDGCMFETIILLSGPVERVSLMSALHARNPNLTIRPIEDLNSLISVDGEELRRARLIGFATPVIVPAEILGRLGYGAYNFHPGPPTFPGLSPAQFAVYKRASRFGVTAHKMAELVDSGPIVGGYQFDIPNDITVEDLERCSYQQLLRLFSDLATILATQEQPLAELSVSWSREKSSRRSYTALCTISPDISPQELERRIAAFGPGYFGMTPSITLHGYKFELVPMAKQDVPVGRLMAAE